MHKKLIPVAIAVCLLALTATAAYAHEHRDVGVYTLDVGFLHEPAYEGLLNGVYLKVTKSTDEAAASHGGHDHHGAAMSHAPMEAGAPVSMDIHAEADDEGGVTVRIDTEGWRWSPDNVNGEHIPGEGHAHIYLNGEKINRIYAPYYYIKDLPQGEHHIRVTLNANSHADLLMHGEPVEATTTITVPQSMSMHHGHAHGSVDTHGEMSLDAVAHPDPDGGYNLQVVPTQFTFTPQNIGGAHTPGEGYALVSIDGESHARLYSEWLKLPALDPGMHAIEVALFSNDHKPYHHHGEPIEATLSVHAQGMEAEAHDHGGAAVGVAGLETTLRVEVTHIPTSASRMMDLRSVADSPGVYTADFIPTSAGQYRFRFMGSIEDIVVDETFESGPGRFADIEPADAIQFPEGVASGRELESGLRGALGAAQQSEGIAADAHASAAAARTLAITGIALGIIGIAVAAASATFALRRR